MGSTNKGKFQGDNIHILPKRVPKCVIHIHSLLTTVPIFEHSVPSNAAFFGLGFPSSEQSLVPPSIIKLGKNRVVLSWRATLGQCSIRTEVPEGSADDQEWARLEEDTRRQPRTRKKALTRARPAKEASVVDVVEVDHVELQTCSGCAQCILWEGSGEEDEEEAKIHRCEPSCWRSVYQGPGCRFQVDLGNGNALHYFRLLVRARVPPPERKGYMRPTHSEYGTGRGSENPSGERGGGRLGSPCSPDLSSPRRRQRNDANDSDRSENTPGDSCGFSRKHDGGDTAIPSRREVPGAEVEGVAQGGEASTRAAGHRVLWFASDPVFVDSRPPPVTLHGIGTALVLTWPPLAGLSGAEQVSYILEQWSHDVASPPPPSSRWAIENAAEFRGGKCHQGNFIEPDSRRWPRRRRQPHRHATPPKQVEAKEVFSVGTRCWFMPTGLRAGRRYWYRLGFIHEGGVSVGGPWVSHLTSVAPPSCVDVGAEGLALSFPRAVHGTDSADLRNDTETGPISDGIGRNAAVLGDGQERLDDGESKTKMRDEQISPGDSAEKDPLGPGEGDDGRNREQGGREEEPEVETPLVWYTLQGLTLASGWVVLYRGPSPEVVVEVWIHTYGFHAMSALNFWSIVCTTTLATYITWSKP